MSKLSNIPLELKKLLIAWLQKAYDEKFPYGNLESMNMRELAEELHQVDFDNMDFSIEPSKAFVRRLLRDRKDIPGAEDFADIWLGTTEHSH